MNICSLHRGKMFWRYVHPMLNTVDKLNKSLKSVIEVEFSYKFAEPNTARDRWHHNIAFIMPLFHHFISENFATNEATWKYKLESFCWQELTLQFCFIKEFFWERPRRSNAGLSGPRSMLFLSAWWKHPCVTRTDTLQRCTWTEGHHTSEPEVFCLFLTQ